MAFKNQVPHIGTQLAMVLASFDSSPHFLIRDTHSFCFIEPNIDPQLRRQSLFERGVGSVSQAAGHIILFLFFDFRCSFVLVIPIAQCQKVRLLLLMLWLLWFARFCCCVVLGACIFRESNESVPCIEASCPTLP